MTTQFIAILLAFVLAYLPSETTEFTLRSSEGKTMEFTKQVDGAWMLKSAKGATLGEFTIHGAIVTTKNADGTVNHNLGELLGVPTLGALKGRGEAKLGTERLIIKEQPNRVSFTVQRGSDPGEQAVVAEWRTK